MNYVYKKYIEIYSQILILFCIIFNWPSKYDLYYPLLIKRRQKALNLGFLIESRVERGLSWKSIPHNQGLIGLLKNQN